MEMKNVLIIIPAYNESKKLEKILIQIKNIIPETDILVINDGSTDNTSEIAKKNAVHVVSLVSNMGYGIALQTGYKFAYKYGYDYIIQIDADGQHSPLYLKNILKELQSEKTDLVIGSRFLEKDSYHPPYLRKIGMKIFSLLTSIIIGQKITDPTSGFKGFSRSTLKFLISDYFPMDYPDADIIIMLHKIRFKIKEIPVLMMSNSGKSMHSGIKPIYYVFKMVLSIFITLLTKMEE